VKNQLIRLLDDDAVARLGFDALLLVRAEGTVFERKDSIRAFGMISAFGQAFGIRL
jgi:hypothetical protein